MRGVILVGEREIEMHELPKPAPGPGEVVVKVAAATLNPTDLLMRSGQQAKFMTDLSPPYIAGRYRSRTFTDRSANRRRSSGV